MESEIFGHVKGAFTDAVKAKKGALEQFDGGTYVINDFEKLSRDAQRKLYRFFDEGKARRLGDDGPEKSFDVRIILTTNKEPDELAKEGINEDFYSRFENFDITLPPLKDRLEDLRLWADRFLAEIAAQPKGVRVEGITDEAWDKLMGHDWPHNLRELRGVLEKAAVLAQGGMISDANVQFTKKQKKGPMTAGTV